MAVFETECLALIGEVTSIDLMGDVETIYSNGLKAIVPYARLANGGVSTEVGTRFNAISDGIAPNGTISPYGFTVIRQVSSPEELKAS